MVVRLLFLLLLLMQSSIGLGQEVMTLEKQQEDFNQAVSQIKKRDLGLYRFISAEQFQNHADSLYSTLVPGATTIEFYQKLSELLVPVQERHLSVKGFTKKSKTGEYLTSEEHKILPIMPYFTNDSAYIIRHAWVEDSTIALPSKLLSINGQDVDTIYNKMAQYINADHGSTTWKPFEIRNNFSGMYYSFVDTTSQFIIEWEDDQGEVKTTEEEGIPAKVYGDSILNQSKRIYGVKKLNPPLSVKYFQDANTAYLKIGSFSKPRLKFEDEVYAFKRITKDFFEEVDKKEIEHVIIDLRNNTGGKVKLLAYLLAYVQNNKKPEVMYNYKRKHRLWWGYAEGKTKTKRQKKDHFDGELYILTNGGSYSASVMFSTVAKQKANAFIAGETPGGRPDGTTAGSFREIQLKHSDIVLRIPETIMNYVVPDEEFNLIPDLPIEKDVSDYFDFEQDTQLQGLIEYIKYGSRN